MMRTLAQVAGGFLLILLALTLATPRAISKSAADSSAVVRSSTDAIGTPVLRRAAGKPRSVAEARARAAIEDVDALAAHVSRPQTERHELISESRFGVHKSIQAHFAEPNGAATRALARTARAAGLVPALTQKIQALSS